MSAQKIDVHKNLRMALQHVRICGPDSTVEAAIEATDDAVAELIEACAERDAANAAWASSAERERQEPGPLYRRARDADARYLAALANLGAAT